MFDIHSDGSSSWQLFHRLDEERSENEDKWKGVAMALQAIKWYYMLTVPKEESGGGLVETLVSCRILYKGLLMKVLITMNT